MILSLSLLSSSGCRFTSPSPSSEPIIVFTFDDQHESVYQVAFPIMQEYGYRGTNFVNTAALGKPRLFGRDELIKMTLSYGWEAGGHTLNHEALNQLSYSEAIRVILEDYQNLQEMGLNPLSFALPKGQCPSGVYPYLQGLYPNIRGSSDFAMYCPINRQALGYLAFQTGWNQQVIKQRIVRGIAAGEALIIIGFHRFNAEDQSYTDSCSDTVFREILSFVKEKNLRVLPLAEAVNTLR
ncbi:MAG: polysaccharide deacetylase family protein [Candidatus Cloacimonadaceae bacterium]